MPLSKAEHLTKQFYEWELRGRGWKVYDYPVELEPPFEPFRYHFAPKEPVADDTLRPTIPGKLWRFARDLLRSGVELENEDEEAEPEPEPEEFTDSEEGITVIQIALPKGQKPRVDEMEHLLLMLSYTSYQISFEIVARHNEICLQFVCRSPDALHVYSQLKAYFPAAIMYDVTQSAGEILWDERGTAVEFGLEEEFTRPITTVKGFDLDPYIAIFGILEHIEEDMQVVMQILFKGVSNPWAESIIRAVSDNSGGHFFEDALDMLPLAKEKIASPLFAVSVRLMVQSISNPFQAETFLERLRDTLVRTTRSPHNGLIPLIMEGAYVEQFLTDFLFRRSSRTGMILNSRELITLLHIPAATLSPKLALDASKTKAPPSIAYGHDFVIGHNTHQGQVREVSLSPEQRRRHTHIIGATGTGKSTLLLNLIEQDLRLGNGLAVMDPHGDLIESILPWIPEERLSDVIIIDPSDVDFPVGFNILSAHSEIEKDILSSDLVAVFKRFSTSWGDQMNSVFANAILAFLESTKGGTLIDLRRFLIEKPFRDQFLKTVTDPSIVYYWQKEFPILKSTSIGPILTRLDAFLRPKLIRNMVAQKESLDFEEILDTQKILLVKLSQGLMGAENSYLLGTFIVSKIQQAAMARQAKAKEDRADFFLYIDEFQNFITPSMSSILSGARKYHLGLILAHQDLSQIVKYDTELASSVLSNAGTRICFRIGDADAKKFESGFSFFDAQDLHNLSTGEAIVRIDRPEYDFNLSVEPLPELDEEYSDRMRRLAVEVSRGIYATEREEVEVSLLPVEEEIPEAPPKPEKRKPEYAVPTKSPVAEPKQEAVAPPIQEAQVAPAPPQSELVRPALELPEPEPTIAPSQPAPPLTPEKEVVIKKELVEKQEEREHIRLQKWIKKMGESRGFKGSIEQPIPDGKGNIDVVMERNEVKLAVEITVTTSKQWEAHNIEKCISAGYTTVVVCSEEQRSLDKIREYIRPIALSNPHAAIYTFLPDELVAYLDQIVIKDSIAEEHIMGYRVVMDYEPLSQEQADEKRSSIARVVIDAMKKKRK
jgi:hypothetical protein